MQNAWSSLQQLPEAIRISVTRLLHGIRSMEAVCRKIWSVIVSCSSLSATYMTNSTKKLLFGDLRMNLCSQYR